MSGHMPTPTTTPKITMLDALAKFVEMRVVGDVGPSVDHGTTNCRYGKQFNGGCAIGCLIPDANYKPEFESRSARTLFRIYPEVAELFEDPKSYFWQELQTVHDGSLVQDGGVTVFGHSLIAKVADLVRRYKEKLR